MGLFDYSELTGEKKEEKNGESLISKSSKVFKKGVSKFKDQYKDIAPLPPKEEPKVDAKKPVKAEYKKTGLLDKSNPLIKLLWMIKKDFKLLIRSKTSALIVLLGPLVIIFLAGMAFNTSSFYNLKVGTYSNAYSDLTNSIINDLGDNQYVVARAESEEKCREGVRLGEFHVCSVFPEGMTIENAKDNTIQFYVDESRLNLAHLVSNTVKNKVASRSKELSLGFTGALLQTIDETKTKIDQKKTVLDSINDENKRSSSNVDNLQSNLNSFSFQFNESGLNFSEIDEEIDDIKSDGNLSGSLFKDLEKLLENLKTSVLDAQLVLGEAKILRDNTAGELSRVKESLTASISGINDVRVSFEEIQASIGNIQVTDPETIVSPIKTNVNAVTGNATHLSFLFPTLVVLVIMFVSVLGAATLVIREKSSKAYFRNFITPTSEFLFMLGLFLTNLILVVVQILILIGVSAYFLKDAIIATLGGAFLVLVISACVFILLGMFIGYMFKNEETSTLGAIAAASLMLFFSNTILPIETLPEAFRKVVDFNPFVLAEGAFKKIVLFGSDLSVVAMPIYYLLGFVVVFFLLAFFAREIAKTRLA